MLGGTTGCEGNWNTSHAAAKNKGCRNRRRRMRFLLPRLLLLAATAIPVPSQSTLALFSRPKPSVAPRAAQRPSLRASSVEAALGSDEVEAELCRGLVAVELVGRVPRTRQGRSLGRHVQMRKDASQRVHAP
jgi:hypothetical protein